MSKAQTLTTQALDGDAHNAEVRFYLSGKKGDGLNARLRVEISGTVVDQDDERVSNESMELLLSAVPVAVLSAQEKTDFKALLQKLFAKFRQVTTND